MVNRKLKVFQLHTFDDINKYHNNINSSNNNYNKDNKQQQQQQQSLQYPN